jgi:hypothetical protein
VYAFFSTKTADRLFASILGKAETALAAFSVASMKSFNL